MIHKIAIAPFLGHRWFVVFPEKGRGSNHSNWGNETANSLRAIRGGVPTGASGLTRWSITSIVVSTRRCFGALAADAAEQQTDTAASDRVCT
jgi:hypothetical protein